MIGGEDDDGIVLVPRLKKGLEYRHHLFVHVLVELIIVAVVPIQGPGIIQDRLHPSGVAPLIAQLGARLLQEVVVFRLIE